MSRAPVREKLGGADGLGSFSTSPSEVCNPARLNSLVPSWTPSIDIDPVARWMVADGRQARRSAA